MRKSIALSSKAAKRQMDQIIDDYVHAQGNNTYNYKQVSHAIGAKTPAQQRSVAMRLAELAFDGEIIEVSPGKFKSPQRTSEATGVFVRRSNGKNSVITDTDGEMIFVAERNSMHALNGDRVRVNIAACRRGQEAEAEVIEIIEKKDQTFIGTLKVDRYFGYLLTDSKYLATDIFIPKSKLKGGQTGDKAVVRITEWKDDTKNPAGEVIDILGKAGENNAEIHAILAEFGLPYKYPEAVEKAADRIDAGITPDVVASRIDMRDTLTFTIDPADAKDFDDALSFKPLPGGTYEVGVHIADVTHYVHPDTIIDREASKRATSVYLVDRVVPMLPEHLCNGICSLRPNEDKLAFSVILEMTADARVLNYKIARTVIRSDRRFSYEEAQSVIETGMGDCVEAITTLDAMAKVLRRERYEDGSVDFDRAEVKFDITPDGTPVGVYFKVSKDANKLIEEFMLLANKTVAAFVGKSKDKRKHPKAFVYRVHDAPDPERLAELTAIARNFGYKIKSSGSPREINRSINKMLRDVKGRGEENYLATLAIRSMAKAVYSTDNIGHYGLGFEYYTHFTSPIRRYPDMLVHRLLARYMGGGRSVNVQKLEDECKHDSDMEKLASDAERASIKYKQVEYMQSHLGETFSGIISGVTEWGLYVELNDNLCEGLVPMRDLADDFYDFDEKNHCLVGRRHNNRYRLGDNVDVKVARADLEKKQLDFVLIDDKGNPLRKEDHMGRKASVKETLASNNKHGAKRRQRK